MNITMNEYRMLKKQGAKYNLKVTYVVLSPEIVRQFDLPGRIELHMRDFEFYSYEKAAAFQVRVFENELLNVSGPIEFEVL